MIRIVSIAIAGQCESGPFSGSLTLSDGLQVITAPNRFGKSLVFAAATWCLGVEQIYGVRAGDNGIFPDAVRRALEVGGNRDVPVSCAEARLVLQRSDGEQLTLKRSIVGGDPSRIHYMHGTVAGDLRVGYGTSSDGTAGFQAQFREWSGLPEYQLVRTQGGEYPIYLENIAPLFLIEQLRGWTSVQAEQTYRYGLQEVADAAFEYLLGLDARLRARLETQQARMQAAGLREEARVVADQFSALLSEQGWVGSLPTPGSDIGKLAERWSQLSLEAYVAEHFNYFFSKENELLQGRTERLKQELAMPSGASPSPASARASQRLIELKVHRDQVQRQVGTLRAQMTEHAHVLRAVEQHWTSAKDLRRLKMDGLGILPTAECPTCQQTIDPTSLELDEQSVAVIDQYIASLDRQRKVLKQGIVRIKTELVAASAEDRSDAEGIEAAERALALTQQAVGLVREEAVKVAAEIMEVERDIERNRRFQSRLADLQRQIGAWLERARKIEHVADDSAEAPVQIGDFEQRLRGNIAALGVGGLDPAETKHVRLGEHYEVVLGDHSLPAYGSASDRARLVMSYVLALLGAGSQHIGFVVLDEPIQQNPDEAHRGKWLEFLCSVAPLERRQIVVFTSLYADERARLVEKGVPLVALEGRFLSLDSPDSSEPAETATAEARDGSDDPEAGPGDGD